jgi:uncharacterized protein (UPF0548 family)
MSVHAIPRVADDSAVIDRKGRSDLTSSSRQKLHAEDFLFCLKEPSEEDLRRFISQQQDSPFSYAEVGASNINVPSGYNVDRNRVFLGRGEGTWRRATEAVREWQIFNIPWVRLYSPATPIEVGATVAVLVRHFGFHSLNAARIVYVVDEDGPVCRYGFAYGTLAEHAESGEERFTVEWDRSEDNVWYIILAFSRPHKTLARLGYPLSRMLQRRFAEASKAAMVAATSSK